MVEESQPESASDNDSNNISSPPSNDSTNENHTNQPNTAPEKDKIYTGNIKGWDFTFNKTKELLSIHGGTMVAKENWPIGITDWYIEAPNEPDSYIPLYSVKK